MGTPICVHRLKVYLYLSYRLLGPQCGSSRDTTRGCAGRGHGVIGAHFAKMTPNFGFLEAFGVIHDPLFF